MVCIWYVQGMFESMRCLPRHHGYVSTLPATVHFPLSSASIDHLSPLSFALIDHPFVAIVLYIPIRHYDVCVPSFCKVDQIRRAFRPWYVGRWTDWILVLHKYVA